MDEAHQIPPHRIYHPIAPELLDEDVIKVIRRLRRYGHAAYLVGGCVRDLLLGVTPKDFDVATSAHPREIRRIFRNSKVVGRRFRLAHILFRNGKVIEVATFRRAPWPDKRDIECLPQPPENDEEDDLLITDDNLFGTPEEDARRRDFTINGLFYDLHSREILDHVHGLPDIEQRVVRAIGDPEIRIQEDPVRILRAIKFASRLNLQIDPPLWDAMIHHRAEIHRSAQPRVLEEIFRLLRTVRILPAISLLLRSGQLELLLPEVYQHLCSTGETEPPTAVSSSAAIPHRFWRLLSLLDEHSSTEGILPDHVLLATLLHQPLLQQLAGASEPLDLGVVVDGFVGQVAARLRLPKREGEKLRQLFIAEQRMAQRRRRSGRRDGLLRRPGVEDALLLYELERKVEGESLDRVRAIRRELGRRSAPVGPGAEQQAGCELASLPEPTAAGAGPLSPPGPSHSARRRRHGGRSGRPRPPSG